MNRRHLLALLAVAPFAPHPAQADTGAGVGGGGPRDVHLFFLQEQQRRAAPAPEPPAGGSVPPARRVRSRR